MLEKIAIFNQYLKREIEEGICEGEEVIDFEFNLFKDFDVFATLKISYIDPVIYDECNTMHGYAYISVIGLYFFDKEGNSIKPLWRDGAIISKIYI